MKPQPPRFADRLLRWFCAPHLLEEIQGDLHEEFAYQLGRVGLSAARRRYWRDVLGFARPFTLRRPAAGSGFQDWSSSFLPHPNMVRNYLKIAWRNLWNNKVYSGINVAGLSIGLTCCLAIGLYIWDEYRFNRFHTHAADIYRVVESQNQAGTIYHVAVSPGPLAPALKTEFAEIIGTCRVGSRGGVLQVGEKRIEPSAMRVVDNSFFSLFDFPLVRGNPRRALLGPDEVVISETVAERLFGADWRQSGRLLGQPMRFGKDRILTLAGVIRNAPANSSLQFDVLLSMRHDELQQRNFQWGSNNYHTYLQLRPGTDVSALGAKLENYLTERKHSANTTLALQPLHDLYLFSNFDFRTDWNPTGSIAYLRIFAVVGLMVLFIALFNFVNLATARASRRAREVGIRKAVGALRSQLVTQFLGEAMLTTLLSVVLSLGLLWIALPVLNALTGKSLSVPVGEPYFGLGIAVFILLVGLLAGLYPAFILSRFQPVRVLKGVFDHRSGQLFRRVLVVVQFTFSVVLVIGAILIYRQLRYIQDKDLGFDQSQLLSVRLKNDLPGRVALMKADLRQESSVASVAGTSTDLVDVISSTSAVDWTGKQPGQELLVTQMNVDPDFLNATGMKLMTGRNFDAAILTDTTSAYLINATAARQMGWTPRKAVGKELSLWDVKGRVIGVVNDFHFRPLTATIEPCLFRYRPSETFSRLLVKTRPGRVREAISAVERIYKKYERETAPQYTFVDQELERQYRTEEQTGRIVLYFALLAIFVSCLGLFGLVTFTAEQRTKEIGIRKVLGASVGSIVLLLSKDFLKLVFIAVAIASPIAWYVMKQWLQDFAYRINIDGWVFGLSATLALLIALLTISFKSIKAALTNPVTSLRSE
ncbi:ABC transporter permease [Larkinella soli]|uniref:ABC transporter permease n=1 Tax=Larkinella soli TaxID=1770527 RepID=UPI0019D267F2|nr:ABC transporter permease [Larkinella soli]